MKIYFLILIAVFLTYPFLAFGRVTPNNLYAEKRAVFESQLNKIKDPLKKEKVKQADEMLYQINQSVCIRFDADLDKLSIILEEIKKRSHVTETVVAFGQGDTPLDSAAYWLNYAAEANAYQKIQDYTPQNISESSLSSPFVSAKSRLSSDLNVLQGKIIRAKNEIRKALNYAN